MENQNQTKLTKQSQERLKDMSDKHRQIAYLVRQSYDTFRTYGSDPSQLEALTAGFLQDLESYNAHSITNAFTQWRKTQNVMPTPADILGLLANPYEQPEVAYDYATEAEREAHKRQMGKRVPWACLSWKQIEEKGYMPEVNKHLIKLETSKGRERAEEYLNYLKTGPQNGTAE